jgi:leucyl aminopeptidase
VLLNLAVIVLVMMPSFQVQVVPKIPLKLAKTYYALATAHAALGSSAAELLHHFARDTPWAHLDIAGLGWNAENDYITDKGPTGFGVRLLVELISSMAHQA